MAEETSTTAPAETPAETPEEKKNVTELNVPSMPTVVDDDVKEGGKSLLESMLDYLKRYNGYNACSVCRIETIPDDTKEWSVLLSQLFKQYMLHHATKADEFKKAFLAKDMCYIQVHRVDNEQHYPTVSADGCYNSVTVDNKPIKSIIVGAFFLNNPDTFTPCIMVRTGPGPAGAPGTLGLIQGNPYHTVTADEAATVIAKNLKEKEGETEAPQQ